MQKTVLITGTSSGIGEAAATAFLADGWNVVATARDPATVLHGIDNSSLLRTRLDLTDTDSIAAAFEAASARSTLLSTTLASVSEVLWKP